MRRAATILHRAISLAIVVAVPAAIWIVNSEIRFEFVVLGLVLGAAYWYWGPTAPLI